MFRSCVMWFAAAALSVSPAMAEWLYSVDVNSNQLVRVDAATAEVEIIGPLTGFDGSISDLEFVGRRLYAVTSVSPNKRLMEIHAETGAIIYSTVIILKGVPINAAAEGLAADDKGGGLIIAFDSSGMLGGTNSNTLGLLGFDGVIELPVVIGRDCDGLCRRLSGGMFGLDREPGSQTVSLFTVSHDPPASMSLASHPFSTDLNGLDDLTETRTGLYALDFINKRLVRFDRATGAMISSIPYDPSMTLLQIAAKPPCDGDADGDGDRDFADVTKVLENFGLPVLPWGPGDADGSASVNFADITRVLQFFGLDCP